MILFHYHAFGLNISSEIELPGILEAVPDKIDVKIIRGEIHLPYRNENSNYLVFDKEVIMWWDDIGRVIIINGKKIIVD